MNYIVILDQWFFQTSFQKRILFCFEGGGKKDMTILQQGALTEKAGSFMKNNEL